MWEQIARNKRNTFFLVTGMVLVLSVLGYLVGEVFAPGAGIIGLAVGCIIALINVGFSYFAGDQLYLAVSGAVEIEKGDHPTLYNVVEEMKIASGLSHMPKIYIIDDPSPNAFATGRDPAHSAVAVTTGLLESMNRDELQGVIAHELAHIQNRDILTMTVMAAMMGAILVLAEVGYHGLRFGGFHRGSGSRRSSSNNEGGGNAAILVLIIVAFIFVIFAPLLARLLYFAVSRQREYLSDACSALYTRYPEGLASALEKIAVSPHVLQSQSKLTAPFYIINPLRDEDNPKMALEGWSSTHPETAERVRILREMAGGGGVSYAVYDSAYRKVTQGRGVLPKSAVMTEAVLPLRDPLDPPSSPAAGAATSDALPLSMAADMGISLPAAVLSALDAETRQGILDIRNRRLERVRETTDAYWHRNQYQFIQCPCETTLKIPPDYPESELNCPHCGRRYSLKDK